MPKASVNLTGVTNEFRLGRQTNAANSAQKLSQPLKLLN
jgi:hypothetical protein